MIMVALNRRKKPSNQNLDLDPCSKCVMTNHANSTVFSINVIFFASLLHVLCKICFILSWNPLLFSGMVTLAIYDMIIYIISYINFSLLIIMVYLLV